MPTMFRTLLLSLVLMAGAGLALTGCGRKGDLDVPGAAPVKQSDPKAKPVVEDRPFILDPLL